jgi:3-deoxy-D-manno-octulosonate 8-phosphate phosphatase (KDO 8-P phosphatase)
MSPKREIDSAITARIRDVKLAVFDVDGVMTDGSLLYGSDGETTKVFNTLDGHGMKMLKASGVELAIISGRESLALSRRARDLGVHELFQAVENKGHVFDELLKKLNISAAQTASIGDDVVDLPILLRCGFAACVPAAPAFVRERMHYVTSAHGGAGAVREFCEVIMAAQGTLDAALKKYLK